MKWSIKVCVVITPRTISADETLYNLSNGNASDKDYIAILFKTDSVTFVADHAASRAGKSLSKSS